MSRSLVSILQDSKIIFTDVFLSEYDQQSVEYQLLAIFSYGVWKDYENIKDMLPEIYRFEEGSNALRKLKDLTILSVLKGKKEVSFQEIMDQIGVDNYVTLESHLINLIGNGFISGKIDEAKAVFICDQVTSRCIQNNEDSINQMINDLKIFRQKIKNEIENN